LREELQRGGAETGRILQEKKSENWNEDEPREIAERSD
jgi:hypothetical protein